MFINIIEAKKISSHSPLLYNILSKWSDDDAADDGLSCSLYEIIIRRRERIVGDLKRIILFIFFFRGVAPILTCLPLEDEKLGAEIHF